MGKALGTLAHYPSAYGGGGGVSGSGGGGGGVSGSGGGGGVSSVIGVITSPVISAASGHPMKATQQIKIAINVIQDSKVVL